MGDEYLEVVRRLVREYTGRIDEKMRIAKKTVNPIVYRLFHMYDERRMRYKSYLSVGKILANFEKLKKVAIVGSSNPIHLIEMLRGEFDAEVDLVYDHASVERSQRFMRDVMGVGCILKNTFFDEIDFSSYDLVMIPEYEYSVPLDMMQRVDFGGAAVACFHHRRNFVDHSAVFEIYEPEDLLDMCGFDEVIDAGREKNSDGRPLHYAIGRFT